MSEDFNSNSSYYRSTTFWNQNFQRHTSFAFSYLLIFIYTLIFLIALIANIFVIVMIIRRRRMRTLTNRFLLNLAVSDLIATILCLPPTAYHYYDKRWIFGEFLCRFVPFMQANLSRSSGVMFAFDLGTSVAVSIFTLMAVSIDRFIAIHKPIHSKLLCTPTRVIITIALTWIISFLLMIPLILHHRIVDPFDITLTACAEEWHQNMNARLVYDFILLLVLFLLPLTLMTYCYTRISFSLWFIDSNVRRSMSSSIINAAKFSTISEDFPRDVRRISTPKTQTFHIHYRKSNDKLPPSPRTHVDENRSLLTSNRRQQHQRRNTLLSDNQTYRQTTSTSIPRRFSENDNNHIQLNVQGRSIPVRQRHSLSQYTSAALRTSVSSLPGQNRIVNGNNHQHRSVIDFEHASRLLQSRRRVVKLLITLVIVFFVTRLPLNILSIYIDITSNTYLPDNTFANQTNVDSSSSEDAAAAYSAFVKKTESKMFLVLYVNPIFQLFSLSNSAINPLCYCFMSHAVKHIMTLFQQKFRRGHKKTSSLVLVQ